MAPCDYCHQEMTTAAECTDSTLLTFKDDRTHYARIPYPADQQTRCHDCNVLPGRLHHPGCDMELCPKCGGQLISCDCHLVEADQPDSRDDGYLIEDEDGEPEAWGW